MKQKTNQKISVVLIIMLFMVLLVPCSLLPVQAANDSKKQLSAETFAATGGAIKAGTTVDMPNDFVTSIKIYKTIKNDTGITFEEESDKEVARDSDFCVAYSYKIPKTSVMPEGKPVAADVAYTFSIQGNFKEALPFRIMSDLILGDNKTAANGTVNGDKLTLTFTKEAETNGLLNEGVEGTFWFGASFDETKIENNGQQEFEIISAGQTAAATINFAFEQITATVPLVKEGNLDMDNKKITWTLTCKPEIKNAKAGDDKLELFVITDVLPKKLELDNTIVSAKIEKLGISHNLPVNLTYDLGKNELIIEALDELSDVNGSEVIVTFATTFDPTASDFLTNNKAVFINKATVDYAYPQYKKDTTTGSPTFNQTIAANPKFGITTSNEKKVEIVGSSLDKKGALLNGTEMKWTISVENKLKLEKPQIKDTLPPDTSLVDGTVQVNGTNILEGDGSVTPSYKKMGDTITFFLENTDLKQEITYHTQFNSDWKDKHSDGKVVNTAEFYAGPGPGLVLSKTATVPLNSQLITKNGTYDKTDHTITWNVDVKNTGSGLTNIVLTDTIPDNQEFIDGTITAIGSTNIDYNSTLNTITITYPDNYNDWRDTSPDITYKTKLTDSQKALWGNNLDKAVNVTNKITLKADGLPGKSFSIEGTVPVTSKVLAKKYTSYSFTDKTVTWQLIVNENEMTLTNPVITDTVPENWEFVQDSITISQNSISITPSTKFSLDGREMTLVLPDMVKDTNAKPYVITYKTHLTDDTLLATNNTVNASNTTVLIGDEIVTGGVKVSASQKIAQAVLEKKGSNANLSAGYLTWDITINRNLAEISALSSGGTIAIQDDLQENLIPLMDSIKVNELSIGTDGKETGRTLLGEDAYSAVYDSKTRALIIDLKQQTITNAYQITFNTDVLVSGSYTNSAYFVGMASDKTATSQAVAANFSGGNTTTSYGTVEITKIDEDGHFLAGAEFELVKEGTSTPAATGITENNGILTFPPVRSGKYTLTETKAPDGHELPESVSQTVTVEKNKTAKITIVNKKTPTPTSTPTPTPVPTLTPIPTSTPTPTPVPTPIPVPVPTSTPVLTPTPTQVPTQVPGGNGSSSNSTPTPTLTPSSEPTESPTPEPTIPVATPKVTPSETKAPSKDIVSDNQDGKSGSGAPSKKEESTITKGDSSHSDKDDKNKWRTKSEGVTSDKTGSASGVPRTGDSSHTILYLVLFLLSGSLLSVLIIVQKKKQNTKDNLPK